jgi:hypothetical protein
MSEGMGPSILAYYSEKANTHASFVVAVMFGIYAVVVSYHEIPQLFFWSSYIALLLIDLYSFANFSLYATLAEIARGKLEDGKRYITTEDEEIKKQLGLFVRTFLRFFKDPLHKWHMKSIVLFVLWFLATVFPVIGMLTK